MLILAVTSATASVGVAIGLWSADPAATVVLAEQRISTDRRHAEELTPMIVAALAEASGRAGRSIDINDVDRFAVDVGPGRFTGLRVGLATVRTLAFASGTTVTGVSSLEALAAAHPGATVTAVIDARRAEVFQQRFVVAASGVPQALGTPLVGDPAAFVDQVASDDLVVGDGADRYGDLYGTRRLPGREPSPTVIAALAAGRPGVDGHLVVPQYLRDADVQINIKTRAS